MALLLRHKETSTDYQKLLDEDLYSHLHRVIRYIFLKQTEAKLSETPIPQNVSFSKDYFTTLSVQANIQSKKNLFDLFINEDINRIDKSGMSALAWAVVVGDVELVDLLMGLGGDTSFRDSNSKNLVMLAAEREYWHIVRYLSFSRVDINLPDNTGCTVLHYAVNCLNWNVVKYLVIEGASPASSQLINSMLNADELDTVLILVERGVSLAEIAMGDKRRLLDHFISKSDNAKESVQKIFGLGNVELLQMLIEDRKGEDLDALLSQSYENLLLSEGPVKKVMKDYVEQELVRVRSGCGQLFRLDKEQVDARILALCDKIESLTECFADESKEFNQEITKIAVDIAKNIEVLKMAVTKTEIPWEQMEFCLVTFVGFFLKPLKGDFEYRLVLDRERMLKHLLEFRQFLSEYLKGENKKHALDGDLEADYRTIKDIYSLSKISRHIKLALSSDDELASYVLMRCLQVIGENLKNTKTSLNLSSPILQYIILHAPPDIIDVITHIRDSYFHCFSYKIKHEVLNKLKGDETFLQNIKNDLKKLQLQIAFLLHTRKYEVLKLFQQKIENNSERRNQLCRYVDWSWHEDTISWDYKIKEHSLIEQLLAELSLEFDNPDENQKLMIKELSDEISVYFKSVYERLNMSKLRYSGKRYSFKSLDSLALDRRTGVNFEAGHYSIHMENFGNHSKAHRLSCDLCQSIWSTEKVSKRARDISKELRTILSWNSISHLKEINHNLSRISDIVLNETTQVISIIKSSLENEEDRESFMNLYDDKVQLHEKLKLLKLDPVNNVAIIDTINIANKHKRALKDKKKVLNTIASIDVYGKLQKSENNDKFLTNLNNMFSSVNNENVMGAIMKYREEEDKVFKGIFYDKVKVLWNILDKPELNSRETLATEALMLDLLEECPCLEYTLSYEEHVPLLVGKSLRNYLAHGTPLIDLLPYDTLNSIKSTARMLKERGENLFTALPQADQVSVAKDKDHNKVKHVTATVNDYKVLNSFDRVIDLAKKDSNALSSKVRELIDNFGLTETNGFNSIIIWPAVLLVVKYAQEAYIDSLISHVANQKIPIENNKMDILTYEKITQLPGMSEIFDLNITVTSRATKRQLINGTLEKFLALTLVSAVENNYCKIVEILMNRYPVLNNIIWVGEYSLLHMAAQCGHTDMIKILLAHNLDDIDISGSVNITPLHFAARQGQHAMVKELLEEYHANINAQTEYGHTALHFAIESCHYEVVRVLIEHGTNINTIGPGGLSPLHLAALVNNIKIMELLIQQPDLDIAAEVDGGTALDVALSRERSDVIKLLMDRGVQFKLFNNLREAVISGYPNAVKALLDMNGNVNSIIDATSGDTALHVASLMGYHSVVEVLIKYGANVDAIDNIGRTPLHHASVFGHALIVKELVRAKAEVNMQLFSNGETPLFLASAFGQVDIVVLLLKSGANPNIMTNEYSTPIHVAVQLGHESIVDILLNQDANASVSTNTGQTPLHTAVKKGRTRIVKQLLTKGKIDVNIQDAKLNSPLHIACAADSLEIAELLIKFNANVNIKGRNMITPLHVCALFGHENIAKLLLKSGADLNVFYLHMSVLHTPLHVAATMGRIKVLKLLINEGATTEAIDALGPIITYDEVIQFLVDDTDTNINETTKKTRLALRLAAIHGDLKVMKLFLDKETDINFKYLFCGNTPFIIAVLRYKIDNGELMELFLERGADVNFNIKCESMTYLGIAVKFGNTKIVEFLLDRGADINAKNSSHRYTALHLAIQRGQDEAVKLLLARGADINNKISTKECTALQIATQCDHSEIMEMLMGRGAHVNEEMTTQEDTALQLAVNMGRSEIVEILGNTEADNVRNFAESITP